ncbi:MAG: aminotransferase class V-fold PLP-dependent enzyme [Thermoanaerobaculia bacterium]|jgi:glutamate/tyrosine decarboxylase-like PLP-dependent enzyme
MSRPSTSDLPGVLRLAHERAQAYLDTLPERPVSPRASFDEALRAFSAPLPDEGEPAEEVIATLASAGELAAVASSSPRFFGYVIGGTLPASIAADWLTSAWDQNAGLWSATPSASAAEQVVAGWVTDLLGLPATASVGFVTGCQMANFTCLAAARHAVLRKAGWNVEIDGLQGAPRIRIVASAEAHVTIHGALKMLGLGTGSIVPVETDAQGRMIASKLREALERVDGPTIVCTQAGNVNTGAFDPIEEIVEAAHAKGAWVHVDGAFGLWAAVTTSRRHLVNGVATADSWATDAHKWLNVPYDSGLAIVAHPEDHFGAMSLKAEYLEKTATALREPLDWVPEFSRRARGFALWAALRSLGRRGVTEMIDRGCDLAALTAELLRKEPGIEIVNDVVVNQTLIRFHGDDPADDDRLTRDVITRVQEDRVCWLSGTRWHDMEAMRFSVSNWSTTEQDIEMTVESIVRCYREARGERR